MLVGGFEHLQKKGIGIQILGNTTRRKNRQSKRAGGEKASRRKDEFDEGANGVVRVQQVLHQAPLRGAEPGPAALQGEDQPQDLLLHDLGLIWLMVEKYANAFYKSICICCQ